MAHRDSRHPVKSLVIVEVHKSVVECNEHSATHASTTTSEANNSYASK